MVNSYSARSKIRIFRSLEACAALHQPQQNAVVRAALRGEIADDFLFEPADRQPVLIKSNRPIVEMKAVHGLVDRNPELGDGLPAPFPRIRAPSFDIDPTQLVLGRSHVSGAVNDGNMNKLSQCTIPLWRLFSERSSPSSRTAVWKCFNRMMKPSRVAGRSA